MTALITGGSIDRKTGEITHTTQACTEAEYDAWLRWLYGFDEAMNEIKIDGSGGQ